LRFVKTWLVIGGSFGRHCSFILLLGVSPDRTVSHLAADRQQQFHHTPDTRNHFLVTASPFDGIPKPQPPFHRRHRSARSLDQSSPVKVINRTSSAEMSRRQINATLTRQTPTDAEVRSLNRAYY